MIMYYKLADDHRTPTPCDFLEWARWCETVDRHVAFDAIVDITISTVFLGINHNFMGKGHPILWETLVEGVDFQEQKRYATHDEAKIGHGKLVEKHKCAWYFYFQLLRCMGLDRNLQVVIGNTEYLRMHRFIQGLGQVIDGRY